MQLQRLVDGFIKISTFQMPNLKVENEKKLRYWEIGIYLGVKVPVVPSYSR